MIMNAIRSAKMLNLSGEHCVASTEMMSRDKFFTSNRLRLFEFFRNFLKFFNQLS